MNRTWFAPSLLLALMASVPSRADVVYTYTGNPFDTYSGHTCSVHCYVSGSFTVAAPLGSNLPSSTVITPESFSLTTEGITLTESNAVDLNLLVGTGPSGTIDAWNFVAIGPSLIPSSPNARIFSADNPDLFFAQDNLRIGFAGPPFPGPIVESANNNPGTWSSSVINVQTTPEPSSLVLLTTGLTTTVGALRIRKRKNNSSERKRP
jgi:hypothetical protein